MRLFIENKGYGELRYTILRGGFFTNDWTNFLNGSVNIIEADQIKVYASNALLTTCISKTSVFQIEFLMFYTTVYFTSVRTAN